MSADILCRGTQSNHDYILLHNYDNIIMYIAKKLFIIIRVLSRKKFGGEGKLGLRAVLAAPGGGCERGMCPLLREARKLSPF